MQERVLGKDLTVSAVGLCCMGFSHAYGAPTEQKEAIYRLQQAVEMAQISLAWMLCKKPYLVPIPGSRKVERMQENAGAADVVLTAEEVKSLDDALNAMQMSDVFGGSEIKKN